MREYLNTVVEADQCDQNVDDIRTAAKNARDLTRKNRATFQCVRQAGLKVRFEKCCLGIRQFEFIGRTISSEGVSQQTHKVIIFLGKMEIP